MGEDSAVEVAAELPLHVRRHRRVVIVALAALGEPSLEVLLDATIEHDKGDFLARSALAEVKAKGPKQQLAWFTAAPELDLFGGEIVLAGDQVIGRVTSAGYGYTCGRNVFCAYVARDTALTGELAVEAMGVRRAAQHHPKPPYDPDRRALLA